jgi:hypothetical protein
MEYMKKNNKMKQGWKVVMYSSTHGSTWDSRQAEIVSKIERTRQKQRSETVFQIWVIVSRQPRTRNLMFFQWKVEGNSTRLAEAMNAWRSALTISASVFAACLVLITLVSVLKNGKQSADRVVLESRHAERRAHQPRKVLGTYQLRAAFPGVKQEVMLQHVWLSWFHGKAFTATAALFTHTPIWYESCICDVLTAKAECPVWCGPTVYLSVLLYVRAIGRMILFLWGGAKARWWLHYMHACVRATHASIIRNHAQPGPFFSTTFQFEYGKCMRHKDGRR